MSTSNQFFLDRRHPNQEGNQYDARQEHGVITLIPNQTNATRIWTNNPPTRVFRQEVRTIQPAPVVRLRETYSTPSMMNATLESWLANKMNGALMGFALLALLFLGAAAIGILFGAGLGQVALPPDVLALLLFVTVGVSVFILGVGLGVGLAS